MSREGGMGEGQEHDHRCSLVPILAPASKEHKSGGEVWLQPSQYNLEGQRDRSSFLPRKGISLLPSPLRQSWV